MVLIGNFNLLNRYNNDLTCKFIESLVESYVGIVVVVLSATPSSWEW